MGQKPINALSEKEHMLLIADILEFFRITPEFQGAMKQEMRKDPRFVEFRANDLYSLVDSLVDARLLWRRWAGAQSIYATDVLGLEHIDRYRELASRL